MKANETHLTAALGLARRHLGRTWPNPSVGCVICNEHGYVVGRGYTQSGGRPHAESLALQMAGAGARKGTAYVTLEPCSHHGQTPPCIDALIAAGLARVVIAAKDPDPRVNGAGIAALRQAGIAVDIHPMAEVEEILAGFFCRVEKRRPLFIGKVAASLDGRLALANGQSQWITGGEARRLGHQWRSECDAILTAIGTVLADDPELTCRLPGCLSPVRIIIDRELRLPSNARLLQTLDKAPLWLITSETAPKERRMELEALGVLLLIAPLNKEGKIDLPAMAEMLGAKGLTRILVEAGPRLTTALYHHHLLDRLLWIQAGQLLGSDAQPGIGALGLVALDQAPKGKLIDHGQAGDDFWFYYQMAA